MINHSGGERRNSLLPKIFYMHHLIDRLVQALGFVTPVLGFVTPVVEYWLEQNGPMGPPLGLMQEMLYRLLEWSWYWDEKPSTYNLNCCTTQAAELTAGYMQIANMGEIYITCSFKTSCCSTLLSWAHTPVINWAVCLGQKVSSNPVRG